MGKALIFFCALLMVAMAGCGNSQPGIISGSATPGSYDSAAPTASAAATPSNTANDASATATDTAPVPADSPAATTASKGDVSYICGVASDYSMERTSSGLNAENVKVFYPQISGLSDETKQARINNLLKSTAEAEAAHAEDLCIYRAIDLDYILMWTSNNLLSVQFYGYYDQWDAAHPINVIISANIDMKTGEMIKLPDIINADSDFVRLFTDKAQFVSGQSTIDYEGIKADYFNDLNLKSTFDEDADYFFTSTGMVFIVNTAHVIGDYSLFSLDFADISEYLRGASQWEDIKPDFLPADLQIIRDQCFKTTLTGFGDVWFVSGFDKPSNGIIKSLKFYLADNGGSVEYAFPDYLCSDPGYFGIRAVSFKDVNNDGIKDVIIITALYDQSEKELDEAKVYLGSGNSFALDSGFGSYLLENLKDVITVADVQNAAKDYFK